jgi:nucleotidyltransferase substrate binding protein (TIGR01987 family)
MERLKERLNITRQALSAFQEILQTPFSKIVRDAAIQRFEFTLEAVWKLAQRYLYLHDGLDLGSPKTVFRGCFQTKLMDETETSLLLQAVSDRNLTVHTYNEELAMEIYRNLSLYLPLFLKLYTTIEQQYG